MTHKLPRTLAPALILCGLFLSGPASAAAQDAPPPPSITIEGSASATLVPDTAFLSLGVVTTRATASEAVDANSRALDRALTTLKAQGIPAEAVRTTALNLTAVYDQPKTGQPTVVGYAARNEIEVRLETTRDLGKLVALVIDEGINSVDGLTFTSNQEAATRDRLKSDAAKGARHDAEVYAAALGLKLGRVLSIRPFGRPDGDGAWRRARLSTPTATAPVPIEPGQLDLTENVSVTFELIP